MGKGGRTTLRNIFVWTYGRGTIQYDIICLLILAFIFLVPRSCLVSRRSAVSEPTRGRAVQESTSPARTLPASGAVDSN